MTTLYDIWLRDSPGDFAAGVLLLARHDGAKHLTRTTWQRLQTLAATGDYIGTYNQGKLENALRATLPAVALAKAGNAPTALPPVPVPPPAPHPSPLTSDKAIALHKEHAHVHALMVAATTDEERAEHARDIMERIIPALDAEYDRLRAAQSPGDFKSPGDSEAVPVVAPKPAADFKKLQSLRSRISTLRKKIPLEKDPKRKAKLEQELSDKITERERLDAELA